MGSEHGPLTITLVPAGIAPAILVSLDHVHDFGLNHSNIMNVIDYKSLERDAGGKPVSPFPHPALGTTS
jgi:hypothetical protein